MTKIEVTSGIQVSPYARCFDEANPNWSKNPEQNKLFLKTVQNMLNEILRVRGHLFLNEAYDHLGFEHSETGKVVGWIWNDGDGYIDFNIFPSDFVNGHQSSILLNFNVNGVIYDHN